MAEFSLLRYGSLSEPCIFAREDTGEVTYGLVQVDETGRLIVDEWGTLPPSLSSNGDENSINNAAENVFLRSEKIPEASPAFFDPFHLATLEDVVTVARYEQTLEALRFFASQQFDIVDTQHRNINNPEFVSMLQGLGETALESD